MITKIVFLLLITYLKSEELTEESKYKEKYITFYNYVIGHFEWIHDSLLTFRDLYQEELDKYQNSIKNYTKKILNKQDTIYYQFDNLLKLFSVIETKIQNLDQLVKFSNNGNKIENMTEIINKTFSMNKDSIKQYLTTLLDLQNKTNIQLENLF